METDLALNKFCACEGNLRDYVGSMSDTFFSFICSFSLFISLSLTHTLFTFSPLFPHATPPPDNREEVLLRRRMVNPDLYLLETDCTCTLTFLYSTCM